LFSWYWWKKKGDGACDMLIDGKRLEGVGVEPDIEVPFDIRFAAGRDIQLQRAEDEIVRLIEAMS
jgi:carboxyl-terminal processing protease